VEWAAVVLSGGGATRLDGADKAALEHDGRTLLQHALDALADASEVVVVGPVVATSRPVTFTRESPPGGGPLAGVSAGVAALTRRPDLVVVLAVDMPHVTTDTIARLVRAAADDDVEGAWLVDDTGRRQLAGAVRPALVPAPGEADGVPMRVLVQRDRTVDVVPLGHEADDVDTWADVARLRSARIDPTPRVDRT
jgi:molybdopterin-guanine dinucleotide biosynthesis protein A